MTWVKIIDGISYRVKNNLLHRGNPRIQLFQKESGKFVYIQFEDRSVRTPECGIAYSGYWCVGHSYKEILFEIE